MIGVPSYGERTSSTLPCVSLRGMKKTGAQHSRFSSSPAIYAADKSSQPPDFTDILRRSYLASEQSPASSHCAYTQALAYCTTSTGFRQGLFLTFPPFFPTDSPASPPCPLCRVYSCGIDDNTTLPRGIEGAFVPLQCPVGSLHNTASFGFYSSSNLSTAINASVGICTVPRLRIFFLPSFCFSSSFFFRVMSPP